MSESDDLDEALERIEKRARGLGERPAAPRNPEAAGRNRLEQAVAEVELKSERNAERTARALQSLTDLVEARGEDRGRIEQTIEAIQKRADRNEQRTVRALDSLTALVEARGGDREGLQSAIERIAKRTEASEARTARALETLLAPASKSAAASEDVTAHRLDALARRAAGAPGAAGEDDDTFRLVEERLARRRKQRQDDPARAAPAAEVAETPAAANEIQRQLRLLAEKVDSLAKPPPAAAAPPRIDAKPPESALAVAAATRSEIDRRASSLQGLERRLDELGARIDATARRAAPDLRPLEELARRVEAVRTVIERQSTRPDNAALLNALAHLNDKLDRASANGSQSAAMMAALQGTIGRLEEALQRPTATPIDPRPIEDLARRIEGVRGLVERQDTLAPKIDQIHAALGDLKQKLDRPDASAVDLERLEWALHQLSTDVHSLARTSAPDMEPVAELGRRIEGMRGVVERQGALAPKIDQIHAALGGLTQKLELAEPSRAESDRLEAAMRQLSADVHALAHAAAPDMEPVAELGRRIEGMRGVVERQGALSPKVDQIHVAVSELRQKWDKPVASNQEIARLEAALRELSAEVHASAPDMQPVEELGRRIEAMRKVMESHGAMAPQVERLERALGEIRTRLDRPVRSEQLEAVDAALRQLAAKFDEVVSRPTTVALDPKPIEELARRIEGVRESLEKPQALAPQVERLETALGAMAEKLDRAQPIDAQGINTTLAMMNSRLEEAFRRPAAFEGVDPQPIEALAAQLEAVRETLERHGDVGRLGEAEFRAIVAAIQALAAKIEGGANAANFAREDVLERIAERLDRFSVEPGDIAALAGAVNDLAAKVERPAIDMSRLEAIVAHPRDAADDLGVIAEAIAGLQAKLAHDEADPRFQQDMLARLDSIETHMVARSGGEPSAYLESTMRELVEKLGDLGGLADTRGLEQELRVMQEKLDDFADARMSNAFAEQTAQAVARALGERLPDAHAEPVGAALHEIQHRLDAIASLRTGPAALEQTMIELTEELDAFRVAREAVSRGATTLSEMRAAQMQFDRKFDSRFSGVQDILEKLVDRLERDGGGGAVAAAARPAVPSTAPANAAMLDIPDRVAEGPRPATAPSIDASQIAAQARARDNGEGAKAAAINAHIAAARRAANAAAAEGERRDESSKARKSGEKPTGGWPHQAVALFHQHRRPVLITAAVAMTLLTGVAAVFELRGHTPERKSELEAPSTPLADATPLAAVTADMTPTGAIASAPKVIAAPLPAAKDASKPANALLAALPPEIGATLTAAAAGGDVGADVEIAQRYLEGRTVPRDPKIAAAWMQAAADAGDAFAQYRLGALYEKGVGVTRDAARARELYTQAAEVGNARAMHNLAVLYAQDGGTGKPDYAKALEWFHKAATYGVRDSQFNLGVLYGRGLGATQDLAQSWMWFSVGARQGDADAARKRDEVANRMDGRVMAEAKKLLDGFKPETPDPAVNNAPAAPAAAAAGAPSDGKAAGVKG